MSCEHIYTDFESDLEKYLTSRFQGLPVHEVQELATYITHRVTILIADLTNEINRNWSKELQRSHEQTKRYYEYVYSKGKEKL